MHKKSRDLSLCVCFNFRKTARAVTQLYDKKMKSTRLQGTQFTLLAALSTLDSVTINNLSRALVMDRTTLTRNLRPLEKRGLIRIKPGVDQRTRIVSITLRGSKRFNDALPLWEEVQAHLVSKLGKNRWQGIMADLQAVISIARAV